MMKLSRVSKKYTPGEKNRIIIIIVALMITLYFGVLFPISQKELTWEENMVSRKLNRIKTRAQQIPEPKVPVNVLQKQSADLDTRLRVAESRIAQHLAGFASKKSTDELKALRLEIAELALASGIQVRKMGGLAGTLDALDDPLKEPPPEFSDETVRPELTMDGAADFGGVLRFLDGLNGLSRHAVVMQMQMKVVQDQRAAKDQPAPPLLVSFRLAL